jgi:DNA-binding response OmpR family regulator
VKAALRRSRRQVGPTADEDVLDFGEIRIDRVRHEVVVRGESRSLTRKEFDLLRTLASNAGRVMTTQALLREVWDCEVAIESRTVDVHIGRVRSKIEENRKSPQFIVTVPRVGYKFVAPSGVSGSTARAASGRKATHLASAVSQ